MKITTLLSGLILGFNLILGFSAIAATPIHAILDPQALDRKIDPCDNFYKFSCQGWQSGFKLPADKPGYWRQGSALTDNVEEKLDQILVNLPQVQDNANRSVESKLAAFYQSCRAADPLKQKTDAQELEVLKARLAQLTTIETPAKFAKQLAEQTFMGSDGFFEFYNNQDPKDSSHVIAYLDRGGMSLPDPDYYLKTDSKSQEIRTRYQKSVSQSLQIVGIPAAEAERASLMILKTETELAKNSLQKDDRRDIGKTFHPMTLAQLKTLVPSIDWAAYIKALGIAVPKRLNVVEPEFFRHLNALLEKMSPADRTLFLQYKLLHRSAYFVTGPLQQEDFNFWKLYLNGQKELPPRWKYCTQIVAGNLSEALGQAYLASISNSAEIRTKTEAMFNNIKAAFAEELKKVTWMDQKTRAAAAKKLAKLGGKIGWPKRWRDYTNLQVQPNAFFANELAASEFEVRRGLSKIGKPTDRTEWDMSIWEPNAYYADANNEMVLPLGELVPPVFDPRFSDGANYAALGGSTIGHELIHGFDDAGKDMDFNGNFVTWWSNEAKVAFEKQSACYIQQTESYDIIPGSALRIRGKATLGENLADTAGVKLGLMALKKVMATRAPDDKVAGFDEIQQFFVAYAQGWCSVISEERLRDQLLSDYHPPPEFRVNVVLANQPEFAAAFQCKPGSKMAPANRCTLW